MRHFPLFLLLAVFFVLTSPATLAQTYEITDIGFLPGGRVSEGAGINQSGQVVGTSEINTQTFSNALHAFLFSNGNMSDLGVLPGGTQFSYSIGQGINDYGQVTGYGDTNTGEPHAFLFSNGVMTDLGALPGGSYSLGFGINQSGQVVGYSDAGSETEHAFLFSNGTMVDLGTLPGGMHSHAIAINQFGQVTGISNISSNALVWHAFLFSNGIMKDLGTLLGGTNSTGRGINQSGQVTGSSDTSNGARHAFIFSNGTMVDLRTLPGGTFSEGWAINQSGQVTGDADIGSTPNNVNWRAFVFSNGVMQDLNDLIPPDSGWTLVAGRSINDKGQITGIGLLDGKTHAFLLSPVCIDSTPPQLTLFATPKILLPASGQMVPVTIWGTITDHGSGVFAGSVEYVVSDEYHRVQPSGHMALDKSGNYFVTLLLRASHESDDESGRRYMIRVNARDFAGNRASRWQAVIVP